MYTKLIFVLAFAVTPACTPAADTAPAVPPEAAAPAAKIRLEAARGTALARVPGKVVEEELEREGGRLVYSFEIRPTGAGAKLKEVHVDANDGSIVAVEDEDEDDGEEGDDKRDD